MPKPAFTFYVWQSKENGKIKVDVRLEQPPLQVTMREPLYWTRKGNATVTLPRQLAAYLKKVVAHDLKYSKRKEDGPKRTIAWMEDLLAVSYEVGRQQDGLQIETLWRFCEATTYLYDDETAGVPRRFIKCLIQQAIEVAQAQRP